MESSGARGATGLTRARADAPKAVVTLSRNASTATGLVTSHVIADRAVDLDPARWSVAAGGTTHVLTRPVIGVKTVTIVAALPIAADAAPLDVGIATKGVTLTVAAIVTATTAEMRDVVANGAMENAKVADATKTEACHPLVAAPQEAAAAEALPFARIRMTPSE